MESIIVNAGGLKMHALHAGQGDPVILIHGYPQTSHEWEHVIPTLAERFDVYAVDTRGHGRTDKPVGSYSRATLAADIGHFMDALGFEKAAVVGHDWGGIIACKFALDWGNRITRLALLDTICTGWPVFVDYYYWLMTDLADPFFQQNYRPFIETLLTGRSDTPVPSWPDSPWNIGELTTHSTWATAEDLDHYVAAGSDPATLYADKRYYQDLEFYRVIADPQASNGERYEHVPHGELARMWFAGEAAKEYLDYAPEDRHKQYRGPVLWMFASQYLAITGGANERGLPSGDPAWESFERHFPDIRGVGVDAGHFFVEEASEFTANTLLEFLGES